MGSTDYALGGSKAASRRLAIQDEQFSGASEDLLDRLCLCGDERVIEIGIGPGGFGRRVMRRLNKNGVLVGVDYTPNLLDLAKQNLAEQSAATFVPVTADVNELGAWIEGADVVVGRTVLHHLPFAETWLGRLRKVVDPGTRIGFIEPEFRLLLARLAGAESPANKDHIETLRVWAEGIVRMYMKWEISPNIGATMAHAMELAGFQSIKASWQEALVDERTIENMLLFYEEVRGRYVAMGIMTHEDIDEQIKRVTALPAQGLPAIWGMHTVNCIA